MNIKARQDLIYTAWELYEPATSTITIEVYMQDGHMPPTVLAVGQPHLIKQIAETFPDLKKFARSIDVAKAGVREWPGQHLAAVAESPAVFAGLFTKPIMDLAFSTQVRTARLAIVEMLPVECAMQWGSGRLRTACCVCAFSKAQLLSARVSSRWTVCSNLGACLADVSD